jgi:hypothetical protein
MPTKPLVCVECDRHDPGDEPGWTLRLDVDTTLLRSALNATEKNSA